MNYKYINEIWNVQWMFGHIYNFYHNGISSGATICTLLRCACWWCFCVVYVHMPGVRKCLHADTLSMFVCLCVCVRVFVRSYVAGAFVVAVIRAHIYIKWTCRHTSRHCSSAVAPTTAVATTAITGSMTCRVPLCSTNVCVCVCVCRCTITQWACLHGPAPSWVVYVCLCVCVCSWHSRWNGLIIYARTASRRDGLLGAWSQHMCVTRGHTRRTDDSVVHEGWGWCGRKRARERSVCWSVNRTDGRTDERWYAQIMFDVDDGFQVDWSVYGARDWPRCCTQDRLAA